MKDRSFDEMIAYFNRRVSEMAIAQDYKMELLGMVTALGFKHEKTAPQWIPCSERLPEEHEWMGTKEFGTTISDEVYVTFESPKGGRFCKHLSFQNGKLSNFDQLTIDAFYKGSKPIAWMPLPEPYKPDDFSQHMNPPEKWTEGSISRMSKGRWDLTPCHEPRRKFCLLNEDGKCRALNDTNFKHDPCPFYKDKRQMDPAQVGQYQEGCEFGYIMTSKYMNHPEDEL